MVQRGRRRTDFDLVTERIRSDEEGVHRPTEGEERRGYLRGEQAERAETRGRCKYIPLIPGDCLQINVKFAICQIMS